MTTQYQCECCAAVFTIVCVLGCYQEDVEFCPICGSESIEESEGEM